MEAPNGPSAERNPESTQRELDKELANGHIIGPWSKPPLEGFRVTPRGIKPEATKDRPITMGNMPLGNAVNDGIPKADHLEMARLQDIDHRIKECYAQSGECWMAKADIKAAYRTQPVRPEDWQLQGIKWQGKYYIDTRMSFGCRSSVDQWLRISKALSYALTRWGVHNLTYIDDFIFIAATKAECKEAVRKFKAICADWGVVLKDEKDAAPAQRMIALGIEYDLIGMTRRITEKRRQEIHQKLQEAKTSSCRRHWDNLIGVLWFVAPCVPIAQPYLYTLSQANGRARHARRGIARTDAVKDALSWWTDFTGSLNSTNAEWHGEQIIPIKQRDIRICMGDAGSEWGMGGFDGHSYFLAPWPAHMWNAVQRAKSTSSLHMEALQALVAARAFGHTWTGCTVTMRLDCLALVATLRNGRHQHQPINDIIRELASLQMKHGFKLNPTWVRRCYNEAADALSKNDMPRFWANVQGNRSKINLSSSDLALPSVAAMPRSNIIGGVQRQDYVPEYDRRPTREFYSLPGGLTARDLTSTLRHAVAACQTADKARRQNSGINHYKKFCARSGHKDLTPAAAEMRDRILLWMMDAPRTYTDARACLKKEISPQSIATYLSQIDQWYTDLTDQSRGTISRYPPISRMQHFLNANFKCRDQQVHGITFEILEKIVAAASRHHPDVARMLTAAYTLAFYAMLRPTEYMLTPRHGTFDETRHMRACDVTFYKGTTRLTTASSARPDRFTVNIKQSKADPDRIGAMPTIGATGTATCPVSAMWSYFQHIKPAPGGPLFVDSASAPLQYPSALRVLRMHIGATGHLYGLHSFRVGGAQALALAGRSVFYIMGRGRWKTTESVSRYVAPPPDTQCSDARAMSTTAMQRKRASRPQNGDAWHTHLEGGRVLPQL